MYNKIQEPTQKISPAAIKVWRINDAITSIVFLFVLLFLLYLKEHYIWPHWIAIVIYILISLVLLSMLVELTIIPIYKQRTWRYEIDNNCIQLKYGASFKKTHLIIPIQKVYYVNTSQGPLLKMYGLSKVKIGTLGYAHEIPCLPEDTAVLLRENIALLSGINQENIQEADN